MDNNAFERLKKRLTDKMSEEDKIEVMHEYDDKFDEDDPRWHEPLGEFPTIEE